MTVYRWTGAGDRTSFGDASNWSPAGGPPMTGDTADILTAPTLIGYGDVTELDLGNTSGTVDFATNALNATRFFIGGDAEVTGTVSSDGTFEIFASLVVDAGEVDVNADPSAAGGVYQYGANATIEAGGTIAADWYIIGYYSNVATTLDVTGNGSLLDVPTEAVSTGSGVVGGLALNTPDAAVNVYADGSVAASVLIMQANGAHFLADDAHVTITQTSTDPINGVAGVDLVAGTLTVQDGATFTTPFLDQSGGTASVLVVDAATLDVTTGGTDAFNGIRIEDGSASFQDGADVTTTQLYLGETGDGTTPALLVKDSTLTATSTTDNGGFSFDGIWLSGGDTTIDASAVTANALQADSTSSDSGVTEVAIQDDGTVSVDTDARLGFGDGSALLVSVEGATSADDRSLLLFGGTLYVADGPGDSTLGATTELVIGEGGEVSADADAAAPDGTVVIAASEGDRGEITVVGTGADDTTSKLAANDIAVGEGGAGTLIVAEAGSLDVTGTIVIGDDVTGVGTVELGDTLAGGEVTVSDLVVGYLGTGDLELTDPDSLNGNGVSTAGGTLVVTGDATIGDMQGGTGTVTGFDANWGVLGTLTVGGAGEADVALVGGSLVVGGDLTVAAEAIPNLAADTYGATLVLSDVALDLSGSLVIGAAGDGNVILGGTAENVTTIDLISIAEDAGSNSAMTVEDPTTRLAIGTLIVGGAGQGAFDVLDGATVAVSGDAQIGATAGSDEVSSVLVSVGTDELSGEAFTNGGASLDVAGQLDVGNAGVGNLFVGDATGAGAVGVGGDLVIGNEASGFGAVMVENTYTEAGGTAFTSDLAVDGDIYVGGDATGTTSAGTLDPGGLLTVANHGTAVATTMGHGVLDIAQAAAATGEADVESHGALAVNEVEAGDAGKGTLTVSAAGTVDVGGDINIGATKTAIGMVRVDGMDSLLSLGGAIAVGLAATGTTAAGTLDPGGVLTISDGAQVQSEGTADGGVDVAVDAGGTGSADIDTATLLVNGITVGAAGAGTFAVTDGTVESANAFDLGETAMASGTVTMDGGTLTADGLTVGVAGAGSFTLEDGTVEITTGTTVGSDKGGTGTLAVNGGTFASDDLVVGNDGTGTLAIKTGGTANIEGIDTSDVVLGMDMGATGVGTVDGDGSALLIGGDLVVGDMGSGTLTVSDAATVQAIPDGTLDVTIGKSDGGSGAITVTSDATLTTGDFVVGADGTGALVIGDGGTVVTSGDAVIGQGESGTGTATLVGIGMADMGQTTWQLKSGLTVGDSGSGTLTLQSGVDTTVEGDIEVGGSTDVLGHQASGTISVQGLGVDTTLEAKAGLTIGDTGTGVVQVSGSGLVKADADVTIGSETNSTGKLVISFGTFAQDGDKLSATWGDQGAAKVTVNQGGVLSAGGVAITLGSMSQGTGVLVLNGDTLGNTATVETGDLTVGDFGSGTVTVKAGSTLTTNGDATLGNTKGGSGTITATGTNADPMRGGGSSWIVTGTVGVGGSAGQAGGTGTITVSNGANAHFAGGLVLWNDSAIIDNAATAGLIEVGGTTADNSLTGLLVDAGGTVSGDGTIAASVDDEGQIVAGAGTLDVTGNVDGAGTLTLDTGSTLDLSGTVASTTTIDFAGDPTLILGEASQVMGTITGFGTGDTIDLPTISYAGATLAYGNGTLSVVDGGTLAALNFAGTYDLGSFTLAQDSHGKAEIESVVCFAEGTRIAVPGGEALVEMLRAGDAVLTPGGAKRVRWVGRRRIDLFGLAEPMLAAPVRIRAGALGAGVPTRDVLLSPDHAVRIDGVLIPARLLLNGTGIVQETGWRSVTYYHVELDRHELLLVAGLEAESYRDTGNRNWFEGEPGRDACLVPAGAGMALATDERSVRPVWERLAGIAARHAGA